MWYVKPILSEVWAMQSAAVATLGYLVSWRYLQDNDSHPGDRYVFILPCHANSRVFYSIFCPRWAPCPAAICVLCTACEGWRCNKTATIYERSYRRLGREQICTVRRTERRFIGSTCRQLLTDRRAREHDREWMPGPVWFISPILIRTQTRDRSRVRLVVSHQSSRLFIIQNLLVPSGRGKTQSRWDGSLDRLRGSCKRLWTLGHRFFCPPTWCTEFKFGGLFLNHVIPKKN